MQFSEHALIQGERVRVIDRVGGTEALKTCFLIPTNLAHPIPEAAVYAGWLG